MDLMTSYIIKANNLYIPLTYYLVYDTQYTLHLLKNSAQSKSNVRFLKSIFP